jgi:DNA adenine methylase
MSFQSSTPLRYPGGKSLFSDYFVRYLQINFTDKPIYAEPYCGGAGLAINLLIQGAVSSIFLNDANFSIYAFWESLIKNGEEFLFLFDSTEISLKEWRKQREIFNNTEVEKENIVKIGFATFYLNRCNRSGILTAGPIGGQDDEIQFNAKYKIDARFNKSRLRERIETIISLKDKIKVYNLDSLFFLKSIIEELPLSKQQNTLVYLDPPYYNQGSKLYLNYYKNDDHKVLSEYLNEELNFKWLLSYDNVKEIRSLYGNFNQFSFNINYSAQNSKLGNELFIPSENSILPESGIIKKMEKKKMIQLIPV